MFSRSRRLAYLIEYSFGFQMLPSGSRREKFVNPSEECEERDKVCFYFSPECVVFFSVYGCAGEEGDVFF